MITLTQLAAEKDAAYTRLYDDLMSRQYPGPNSRQLLRDHAWVCEQYFRLKASYAATCTAIAKGF